ncbi:MAG: hypothetical protein ACI8YQ_002541 [Polaribacter sp.]|jgi:hypothetical protein
MVFIYVPLSISVLGLFKTLHSESLLITTDPIMIKKQQATFKDFLQKFPKISLPVTLTEDSHHDFSKTNDPIPALMVEEFLMKLETEEVDEFTEYIPCFRIPKTDGFTAIVYFKAGLLNYEYNLLTFNKDGLSIDKKVIAGTKVDGNQLQRTVATIEDDWIIYCVRGVTAADNPIYDSTTSESLHLELLATGEIIFST